MRVFGEALSATLVPAAPFTLLPHKFTLKARSTRESPRKAVHLSLLPSFITPLVNGGRMEILCYEQF